MGAYSNGREKELKIPKGVGSNPTAPTKLKSVDMKISSKFDSRSAHQIIMWTKNYYFDEETWENYFREKEMNKEFIDLIDKMRSIHESKAADYASSSNVDENFERVAIIQEWFNNPIDKAFAGFIAVKLARLAVLLNAEHKFKIGNESIIASSYKPNNESIDDSFLDMTVYSGLWGASHKRRNSSITKLHNDNTGRNCSAILGKYQCNLELEHSGDHRFR